jgi:hypothetical protein
VVPTEILPELLTLSTLRFHLLRRSAPRSEAMLVLSVPKSSRGAGLPSHPTHLPHFPPSFPALLAHSPNSLLSLRISINPSLSSSPRYGFPSFPPFFSICPAQALQLTGFNCSEPRTRPKQARNTETRVSSFMSRGREAVWWVLRVRVENSWAE